jgi:hypothetical protein
VRSCYVFIQPMYILLLSLGIMLIQYVGHLVNVIYTDFVGILMKRNAMLRKFDRFICLNNGGILLVDAFHILTRICYVKINNRFILNVPVSQPSFHLT